MTRLLFLIFDIWPPVVWPVLTVHWLTDQFIGGAVK